MSEERPYCLSIAGLDPCGGAGVLADVKTFEQLKVLGLGVVSAITYQNDAVFSGVEWYSIDLIEKQLIPLKKYRVVCAKIGLIENFEVLNQVLDLLHDFFPAIKIVWDPVLKASAGFRFHADRAIAEQTLKKLYLITPNSHEYEQLKLQSNLSCHILLKGGHREEKGLDTLFYTNGKTVAVNGDVFQEDTSKHGTGCVLSSAISSYLALENNLDEACKKGKEYVERFMLSNKTNLGYHV